MLLRVVLAVEGAPLESRIRGLLRGMDVVVESMAGIRDFWVRVAAEPADLLLVSRPLIPDPLTDSIRLLRDSPESTAVLVLAAIEDAEDRGRLLAAGCEAVVVPDLDESILRPLLREIVERRREWIETRLRRRDAPLAPRLSDFATKSPSMQAFMAVVSRVVDSNTTLLVQGETGVGKERLARAIHAESRRGSGPFIAVNCSALPETLLESELFGHEEGSFTGATRTRRGWFELAHGGTILLDEIAEVPLHVQVKLLRALQEREIQPIGGEKPVEIDVRVIAATNRDLETAVDEGAFRRDLYYRLSVVTLTLPPLREREEDIPDLVSSYLEYFGEALGREFEGIEEDALQALLAYSWPGNVRELMNVIERAVLLGSGPRLTPADLPGALGRPGGDRDWVPGHDGAPALAVSTDWLDSPWRDVRRKALLGLERAYLAGLLDATGGRVGDTARLAGIRARSLYDKMKLHGLRKEDFRGG